MLSWPAPIANLRSFILFMFLAGDVGLTQPQPTLALRENLISSSRSSDSPVEHQSSQWDPCISSHPRRWQKGKRKKEKATSNLLHRSLVRSSDQTVRSTTPMYIWAVSTFSHSVSTSYTLQIKGDNTCSPSHRLQISKLLGGLLVGERAHGWVLLPFHFAQVPPSCL